MPTNGGVSKTSKQRELLDALYRLMPGPVAGTVESADFLPYNKVRIFDEMRVLMYPPPYIQSEDRHVFYMPTIDRCHPVAADIAYRMPKIVHPWDALAESIHSGGCYCDLDEACERARGAARYYTAMARTRELEQEST